jgi:hypothetical protein
MGSKGRVLYPESRFLVPTGAALAAVLGVSAQAVSKASAAGRIEARTDGWWDLFDVLEQWRGNTRWSLQRATVGLPPWLDLALPVTQGMVDELVRRANAQGAYEWTPKVDTEDGQANADGLPDVLGNALTAAVAAAFDGLDTDRLRGVLTDALRAQLPRLGMA